MWAICKDHQKSAASLHFDNTHVLDSLDNWTLCKQASSLGGMLQKGKIEPQTVNPAKHKVLHSSITPPCSIPYLLLTGIAEKNILQGILKATAYLWVIIQRFLRQNM